MHETGQSVAILLNEIEHISRVQATGHQLANFWNGYFIYYEDH